MLKNFSPRENSFLLKFSHDYPQKLRYGKLLFFHRTPKTETLSLAGKFFQLMSLFLRFAQKSLPVG